MSNIAKQIRESLKENFSLDEAKAISLIICNDILGIDTIDIYTGKDIILTDRQRQDLDHIIYRLKQNEPIQYVIGYANFFGRRYKVDKNTLIPRPETTELVQLIIDTCANKKRFLDIGTGSGCIAITLAKEIDGAEVEAWDISVGAINIAKQNSDSLDAGVKFKEIDVLSIDEKVMSDREVYDVIVSNPPYITEDEKAEMERNVLDWEPHSALFVAHTDPILFYRKIAHIGTHLLKKEGWIFFEINRAYGKEVTEMLKGLGYNNIELKKDTYGNDRMVYAQL
ncbi:MAG: peptide chain release factor N(5)-glutamine methyltransferase [Bacteroides sp.]|nr:peptide chain release factor N(5)-glutamine methyltransferase [Bacteroides sp.]